MWSFYLHFVIKFCPRQKIYDLYIIMFLLYKYYYIHKSFFSHNNFILFSAPGSQYNNYGSSWQDNSGFFGPFNKCMYASGGYRKICGNSNVRYQVDGKQGLALNGFSKFYIGFTRAVDFSFIGNFCKVWLFLGAVL